MEYVGFVQYGTMMEFRDELRQQGEERSFKKGENLIPYLTKNDKLFYLDTGIVYLRLYKPDGSYFQLMAFLPGTILPFINLNRNFPYSDLQMLVAAREEVSGFVFPREYFRKKRKTDIRFAELLEQQWMKSIEYLYVSQLLYREGDAVTRISNLLYHVHKYKNYDAHIFPMGQEELANTVNISVSQAKRALAQLKEEEAIELKYGEIIIKNIEVVKKHISETLYIQEEQKEIKRA